MCVCVKEKDMHGRSGYLSGQGDIIFLTRGKPRCEKTVFYSTNHFPSDPLERVDASRCQNWWEIRGTLNDFSFMLEQPGPLLLY